MKEMQQIVHPKISISKLTAASERSVADSAHIRLAPLLQPDGYGVTKDLKNNGRKGRGSAVQRLGK